MLDLRRRRHAIDYGPYATVYEAGREWGGRPGRPRRTSEAEARPVPLWLMDLLAGVVDGSHVEPASRGATADEDVACHVRATVDLALAAERVPGLYIPSAGSVPDPHAVPIEVWIKDQLVTRLVLEAESQRHTLELYDHGLPLDDFDWSRLPEIEGGGGEAG